VQNPNPIVTHRRFDPTGTDWGFNQMIKLSQLAVPIENFARPLIENDRTRIIVHMRVVEDQTGVLWHNFVW
jgi:ubiquitin carboxyl-terminal hydrolase 7